MNFIGNATKLIDADLPRIGMQIGCGEDEIHSFLEVETTGSGFDDLKRPKILYEYHIFYRHLTGAKLASAVAAGLATKIHGMLPYGKPSEQYPRLLRAMAIDETAALKACSWGIGQVLGQNYIEAGFVTVQAMVAAMVNSEAAQLQAAVDFIKANHLDDELRSHNWAGFARGYNGASYAKFGYDKKLASAYKRWADIRDTPYRPPLSVTLHSALNAPGVVKSTSAPTPLPKLAPGPMVDAGLSTPAPLPPFQQPAWSGPHNLPAPAKETWGEWLSRLFFVRKA